MSRVVFTITFLLFLAVAADWLNGVIPSVQRQLLPYCPDRLAMLGHYR
jgi:hypothetical protein